MNILLIAFLLNLENAQILLQINPKPHFLK
jgi:hypothetical protein